MKLEPDLYVEHLQKMIQFPTISYADSKKMDFAVFTRFQQYLEHAYPLVHQHLQKQIIGKAALLYHWKGSGRSDRLPLMLIAHQDVVAAENFETWKYEPFSGKVADGCVWGRGATDCKSNIQAYFDALEYLLGEGFVPACDLYIGLGYNEEIVGSDEPSGKLIAEHLMREGISLGCLLDEGGGLEKNAAGEKYAFVYIAEKGFANFQFTQRDSGGHSSIPGPSTALGKIAKVICAIEEHPMEARLLPMVAEQLKMSAPYMERKEIASLAPDAEKNWNVLKPLLESDRTYNALIRSTTAVTMAEGSAQPNILPEKASITVNCRLLPGDSVDDLRSHFEQIVPDGTEIELLRGTDPPRVQSSDTEAYRLLSETLQEMFGDIPVVPCMLYGGTDSRYYVDLCPRDSVYRFTCLQYDERWAGLWHKTNERIPCDILSDNVEFYIRFIQKYAHS